MTFCDLSSWPPRSPGSRNSWVLIVHWVQHLCQLSSKLKGVGSISLRFDVEWPLSVLVQNRTILRFLLYRENHCSFWLVLLSSIIDKFLKQQVQNKTVSVSYYEEGIRLKSDTFGITLLAESVLRAFESWFQTIPNLESWTNSVDSTQTRSSRSQWCKGHSIFSQKCQNTYEFRQ